jgi:hypothetical protein
MYVTETISTPRVVRLRIQSSCVSPSACLPQLASTSGTQGTQGCLRKAGYSPNQTTGLRTNQLLNNEESQVRERKTLKRSRSRGGISTIKQVNSSDNLKGGKLLLEYHRRHAGLYRRVAEKQNVYASYVSRVASGERKSLPIERALSLKTFGIGLSVHKATGIGP